MKTKEIKKINILINGDENNKSEIVYNNVIQNMGLNEEEQVKYLKTKITHLELELKNKTLTALLSLISALGIGFGLFLMVQDLYFLGSLFITTTFVGIIVRFYLMYKNVANLYKSLEFEKIEQLRKILNDRIK